MHIRMRWQQVSVIVYSSCGRRLGGDGRSGAGRTVTACARRQACSSSGRRASQVALGNQRPRIRVLHRLHRGGKLLHDGDRTTQGQKAQFVYAYDWPTEGLWQQDWPATRIGSPGPRGVHG